MADALPRYPGETLIAWANRNLMHRGRTDVEWYYEGSSLRLRPINNPQSKLDLG